MHYYVFDTSKPQGWAFRSQLRWIARIAAWILGPRFDYTTVAFHEDGFNALTF